ncbi:Uncharacterised protein [Canicola haemoglobinophilus]|uniref:Uncharacterized protein n=1 Tax=Canicola haemoglobinophilus TaxID=733 RepID=A0AB38H874_9PAST|nr:hypothetical protein [Canicola haemoglobinophilus]STO53900.1 Uncharacterised protein [Canicola haemoglobinophilus]STO68433.1 Uncharacterised protein [Canicola haemoglobinophilus]
MLDVSHIIKSEMRRRELKYISLSELVRTLHHLNKTPIQNSEIGDFLLFKLKSFNPYVYEDYAENLPILYCQDLSDITTDLVFTYDFDLFLEFINSLSGGRFEPMKWESYFFERDFISEVLDIAIPINNNTQIKIYQNEPFTNEELQRLSSEPKPQTELNRINTELEQAKATIQAKDEQIAELEKQLEQAKRAESAVKSDDNLEYVGNVPLNSNEEKLADFIDLLLELGSITNKQGLKPTYSELYTILDNKFRNRKKPSKNTIRKYEEPLP